MFQLKQEPGSRILEARAMVVDILMARLPLAPVEKRDKLRAQIAGVKCGRFDSSDAIKRALARIRQAEERSEAAQGRTAARSRSAGPAEGGAEGNSGEDVAADAATGHKS